MSTFCGFIWSRKGGDKEEANEGGRGVNAQVEVQRKSSRCPKGVQIRRSHLGVFDGLSQNSTQQGCQPRQPSNVHIARLKNTFLLILLTTQEHLDYLICTSLFFGSASDIA